MRLKVSSFPGTTPPLAFSWAILCVDDDSAEEFGGLHMLNLAGADPPHLDNLAMIRCSPPCSRARRMMGVSIIHDGKQKKHDATRPLQITDIWRSGG